MKNARVYRVTMLDWVCPHCDKFHGELDLGEMDYGSSDMTCKGCKEVSRGVLAGDTEEWKQIVLSKSVELETNPGNKTEIKQGTISKRS